MLRVRLLGGTSVEDGGVPLSGPAAQRHRVALLALLAGAHPAGVAREKLLALLWPEREGDRARNLLNQAVHALRNALGEQAIRSVGDELRLDAGRIDVDVVRFEAALEEGDPERAVQAYAGPFLDGFFLPDAVEFERWAERERERLRRAYLGAVEGLAEEAGERGDVRAAAGWWRRLAAEDPHSSRVTLRLMRALEATGNRAAAIRSAEAHATLLERELGAEPSPEVSALAARMRSEPRGAPLLAERGERVAEADEDEREGAGNGDPGEASRGAPAESTSAGRFPRGFLSRRREAVLAVLVLAAVAALFLSRWLLPAAEKVPAAAEGADPERKTIAVLPFEDLTGTPDAGAFTEGIHTDLITALSGVSALRVISRSSVLPYRDRTRAIRDIADELGAHALVEGGVQRLGDRVRVNVQLTEPRSGELLWSESYTRELSVENLFAIQSEMTRRIASSLEASLTAAERERVTSAPTEDLTAYQYYHQANLGSHTSTLSATEEAERLLRLALEADPNFAPAWAALAREYGWRAPYLGVSTSAWDSASAYARRAIELDPEQAGAHTAMALTSGHQGFLARQEEAARRALALRPNDDLAVRRLAESHRERGAFPGALRLHRESVRLSPHELVYRSWVGHVYSDLGDLEQAARWYRAVLALRPDYLHALWGLAALHLRTGRTDSAAHYAERMAVGYPDETVPLSAAAMVFHYLGDFEAAREHAGRAVAIAGDVPAREVHSLLATTLLGFAELRSGDAARAGRLFDRSLQFLESMVASGTDTPRWPYEIALIRAARGDLEGAMGGLETAYDRGFRWAWMLEFEPMLDPLRDDLRFRSLLARVRADVEAMARELDREEGRGSA